MSITIQVTIRCKKHPRYKANMRPKAKCDTCEAMWAARHDVEEFIDRTFFSDSVVTVVDQTEKEE